MRSQKSHLSGEIGGFFPLFADLNGEEDDVSRCACAVAYPSEGYL
jgi:hypothetical protein